MCPMEKIFVYWDAPSHLALAPIQPGLFEFMLDLAIPLLQRKAEACLKIFSCFVFFPSGTLHL